MFNELKINTQLLLNPATSAYREADEATPHTHIITVYSQFYRLPICD